MFPVQLGRLAKKLSERLPRLGVGIDIGRSAVRVAALRDSQAGIELVGMAAATAPLTATPPAWPSPMLLRDLVGRACKGYSWWPRRVAMAVAAGGILARSVPVAAGASDDELAETVERAARQLPVGQAELSLVWVPLVPGAVLMVAARREAVAARQCLAARAGLGPVVVDVDLFAGLRVMAPVGPDSDVCAGDFLLVDAGVDSLRVLAQTPGQPLVFRVLTIPQACTAADLADLVAEAVRDLPLAAVSSPMPITLAGGRVVGEGVLDAVAARLGLPCRLADPFAAVPDPRGLAAMSKDPAALWSVASGLAGRALA